MTQPVKYLLDESRIPKFWYNLVADLPVPPPPPLHPGTLQPLGPDDLAPLFPMSLILSLDHLDNPRRAGGLTAFVQGIGYLIAGLSPLIAGMIRDQLGSFEWAWWALTAVVVVMLLIVTRFNPQHYARHIR